MRNRLLVVAFVAVAAPALADIPPPPGSEERYRGELIRKAGHSCNEQPTIAGATDQQRESFMAKGLSVVEVRCSNGQRFLVGTPPRRYGAPRPDAPPPAEPVVQKLD